MKSKLTSSPLVPPLDGAVIQRVVLIDRITRNETGWFKSTSPPGHLIHLVTEGRVRQESNGCRQECGPGDAVWYYENEWISGEILEAPWTFYTIAFVAPTLPPPPFEQRVRAADKVTDNTIEQLLAVWRDTSLPPTARHLQVHSLLMRVILALLPDSSHIQRIDRQACTWWHVEDKLRQDLSRPISLKRIVQLANCSQRAIVRSCHAAVGLPPMRRVKEIRLSYARGLVFYSNFSMTEIALRVGYSRVQELSRDYRLRFGVTPSEDRDMGPDYRLSRSSLLPRKPRKDES